MKYTVHDPGTHLKIAGYARITDAFRRAYTLLPLDTPGKYHPDGRYVTVQEWDDASEPLRQWLISGRRPDDHGGG